MNIQIEILKYIQSFRNPILNIIFLLITMSTEIPVILIVVSTILVCK